MISRNKPRVARMLEHLGALRWQRKHLAALFLCLPLAFSALTTACQSLPPNSIATHDSSQWAGDLRRFAAQDATNRPAPGSIVFVGSSSIRLWTNLTAAFPGFPVVNRGFGGSQIADAVNLADQLVSQYRPRQVVIYSGGNDINAGKEPEVVYGDFVALVKRLRTELPRVNLAYISSAPSPQRWAQVEKVKRLNSLIEHYSKRHGIAFINVFPLMLGPDGQPRPDIYVADRLHLNEKGYAIWGQAVRPFLN